jgi:hypothetical protein
MALTEGNEGVFKYDIAFSFVKEDESLATELNDRVRDRYPTFLYARKRIRFHNIYCDETGDFNS